jgi:hypothetical protein
MKVRVGRMGVVVERGSTRCPHCVAIADYAFIEGEPDVVRYEVHCRSCGETYTEVNSLAPPESAERVMPLLPPLPTPQTRQHASWRSYLTPLGRAAARLRARVRLAGSGGRVSADAPASGGRGPNG